MLEVEIKAFTGSRTESSIESTAIKLGFTKDDVLEETDLYFNGNDRNFIKTDEALRLRTCLSLTKGTSESYITYKGPKLDDRSSTRKEFETAVGSFDVMKALLASLGYTQAFTISKTRKTWILNRSDDKPQITLCIDSVTGLGNYAELETLVNSPEDVQRATDMLLDMLNAFNIPRENLTRKSYLELLFMANKC